MDKRAIGVFDSGLGGLTAVRRLHALMPQENIIYFGDTGRVPYGTRGRDTITKYARQDVAFLRQFDLKSIIIACNTVSAIALDLLQTYLNRLSDEKEEVTEIDKIIHDIVLINKDSKKLMKKWKMI